MRRWWRDEPGLWRPALLLLLTAVLAILGTATFGADQHVAAPRHDAALTAHEANPATLARSAGRLLAERPADHVQWATLPPNTDRPAPFVRRDHRVAKTAQPRIRQAPSTGDRAPPSH